MSGAVANAAVLVLFPVGATAAVAAPATWRAPGERVTSGVQHFAAGVELAALAGEVLPDLRAESHLPAVLAGFTVGFIGLYAIAG